MPYYISDWLKNSKHLNDYYNIRHQITTHRQKQQAKPTPLKWSQMRVMSTKILVIHREARSNQLFMFCKIFCGFKRLNVLLMVTAKSFFVLLWFKRKNTKTAVGKAAQGKSSAPGKRDAPWEIPQAKLSARVPVTQTGTKPIHHTPCEQSCAPACAKNSHGHASTLLPTWITGVPCSPTEQP